LQARIVQAPLLSGQIAGQAVAFGLHRFRRNQADCGIVSLDQVVGCFALRARAVVSRPRRL
jgi:hypothetical protein